MRGSTVIGIATAISDTVEPLVTIFPKLRCMCNVYTIVTHTKFHN